MSDDTANPTPAGAISRVAEAQLYAIRGPVMARVLAYDSSAQRVTVRVLVADPAYKDGLKVSREVPKITVRVMWPAVGGVAHTAPIDPGDDGWLFLPDRSHAEVYSGQGDEQVTPASSRRWNYADAWFSPVSFVSGAAKHSATDPVVWMDTGKAYRIGSATASRPVADALLVNNRLTAIESFLSTHVHSGGTLSGGLTGTATGAPSGSSVASDRLFVDG